MKLHKLLTEIVDVKFADVEILDISNDSRIMQAGSLFIAYPGAEVDGRDYIASAIANGASAVLYESSDFKLNTISSIPVIPVNNLKTKLADIAANFYSNPTQHMRVIGVTGTNGKTTVAHQLANAYNLLGCKSAYIGTIGQGVINNLQPIANTTPDSLCLQKLFNQYRQANITHVSMEVSSHALAEGRTANINFEQAIYTNLTHEHLDFHKTMQAYAAAKAKLFACDSLRNAVINLDDGYASFMLNACAKKVLPITYSLQKQADLQAVDCSYNLSGCTFKVLSKFRNFELTIKGVGDFNVYNSLAILASLLYFEYDINDLIAIIANLTPVNGRMELVSQNPYVFIDYSHTPDALQKALISLTTLKNKNPSSGKIWVVFGCGGDRDKTKRPLMGQVAVNYADMVVVTSDNPRTEDPEKIINDICMDLTDVKNIWKISNRKDAILFALTNANQNDLILVAGKGHEEYQIIGHNKLDFSDKKLVQKYQNAMS